MNDNQPTFLKIEVPDGSSSEYIALIDKVTQLVRFDYNHTAECHEALILQGVRFYTVPASWVRVYTQPEPPNAKSQ